MHLIRVFLVLTLGSAASSALAKPIELMGDQLDIGLTALPLWVENRLLEESLIELRSRNQLGSLLPTSPGPGPDFSQGSRQAGLSGGSGPMGLLGTGSGPMGLLGTGSGPMAR